MLKNALMMVALCTMCGAARAQNTYVDTVLVASSADYRPLVMVDPLLSDGWGIALRPPGAGGHIWVSNFNTGTTTTYVGDVHDVLTGEFTPLFQDSLKVVDIAVGSGVRVDGTPVAAVPQVTGQVYNYSASDFVVSGEGITAASKFIFVTAEGTISGWTEMRDASNVLHRQTVSVIRVDQSAQYDDDRLRYTGVAVTDYAQNNRLFAANFTTGEVEVYDHLWQRVPVAPGAFRFPDQQPGYSVWNVQYLRTGPGHEGRLWVAYAHQDDPWEEDASLGAVAEFDMEGNFIRRLATSLDSDGFADSELKAPWGMAIAPPDFGPLSGTLLVANFGDGSIASYDLQAGTFIDYLRDASGNVLLVDGIWGITFGNGVGLGDSNALYYAAGPNGELDGTFGTVRYVPSTCPVIRRQPANTSACSTTGNATVEVGVPSPVRLDFAWQAELAPGVWTTLTDGMWVGPGGLAVSFGGTATDTLRITGLHLGAREALAVRVNVSDSCAGVTSTVAHVSACPADFDCSGFVDLDDFGAFVSGFELGDAACDFDGSGFVDTDDFDAFVAAFERGC